MCTTKSDSYLEYKIFLTKVTATENEVALSYHRVRGLYFLAVVFVVNIAVFTQNVYCADDINIMLSIVLTVNQNVSLHKAFQIGCATS